MRLHGILLTRDDDDIVAECVSHALTWCDALYVLDTGSSDATRDLVATAAARDRRVIRVNENWQPVLMESGLRAYVFHKSRHRATAGDWFAQVDVDEFYHLPPRQFIQQRLHRRETAVWSLTCEFRLTETEVLDWQAGRESLADRSRPIAERRRYYNVLSHSEPRMFRYRPTMQWPPSIAYPYNTGFVARERILIRHYPHRDPLQLEKRWLLRKCLASSSDPNWNHWRQPDWSNFVATSSDSGLHHWDLNTLLPEVSRPDHLPSCPKRASQWFAHSLCLPFLDWTRQGISPDYQPAPIPAPVNALILHELAELQRRCE